MTAEAAQSEARATLLRALDALDQAEQEFGPAKHTYLVVAWAHQVEGQTVRGWTATDEPTFVSVALLREVADAIESGHGAQYDDDEPDNDDESEGP